MNNLKNKKVLFFAPTFFGYEIAIFEKLKQMGAEVDYFDERPRNNFFTKACIRINRKLLERRIFSYYHSVFEKTRHKQYDYVFFINIEAMLPSLLNQLRRQQPEAQFILYMWDSLQNKKRTQEFLPFFNKIYSFDPTDAKILSGVKFRPLFFTDEYGELANNSLTPKYGLCFIGTVHSDRYLLVEQIKKQVKEFGLQSLFFMFFPSPLLFYYKKMRDFRFYKAKFSEFNFSPLSQRATVQNIKDSAVILDIHHPAQTGLTMRTIEMLGANKKIITTNPLVKDYDFFHPQNILVIDREKPLIDSSFFDTKYLAIDSEIRSKYSLRGWLMEIFGV